MTEPNDASISRRDVVTGTGMAVGAAALGATPVIAQVMYPFGSVVVASYVLLFAVSVAVTWPVMMLADAGAAALGAA